MMENKKHMFRPRELMGWGLHPQTALGWLVSLLYVVVLVAPLLISVGILTDGFAHNSQKMPLSVVLSMIWIFIGAGVAIAFAVWYLKKYYPKEK